MQEIDKAIEDLKKEYERAKNIEHIKNPLGWALYRTWEKYNSFNEVLKRDKALKGG